MIKLIINADDFGYSKLFNEKILELIEKGFIKSTTVLVNSITPDQKQQVARLKTLMQRERVSTGLHCEFDISKPLRAQIQSQYELFKKIFGAEPSHLDIHKLDKDKPVVAAVYGFAEGCGLPARNNRLKTKAKRTSQPAISATHLTFEELKAVVGQLKDGESYELVTHPGAYDPDCKSSLNKERGIDYNNIIKIQDFLKRKKIRVINYYNL